MTLLEALLAGTYWIGSEEHLESLMASLRGVTVEQAEAMVQREREYLASARVDSGDGTDPTEADQFNSAPVDYFDNVAVINVKGQLVNADKWYLKYFGLVGYPHIQDSIAKVMAQPEITDVVFNYDTPGGQANGVNEVAAQMQELMKVKNVHSFNSGMMASGGYWLGVTPGLKNITADKMAVTGSIGVLVVHTDMSGYYKDMGIKHTILRKGEFKALVSPLEPLSDKAKAQIDHQMNFIYDHFTQHIANSLGRTQADVQEKLGTGQVWLGQEAVDVGAISKISTLSEIVANYRQVADNRGNPYRISAEDTDMNEEELKAKAEAEAKAAEENKQAQVAAGGVSEAQDNAVIGELRTQLSAKDTELVNVRVELAAGKAELEKAQTQASAMAGIVRASLNRMSVALGAAESDYASLDVSALVAQHTETEKQFAAKFPTGGVAAVAQESEAEVAAKPQTAELAAHQARIKATLGR